MQSRKNIIFLLLSALVLAPHPGHPTHESKTDLDKATCSWRGIKLRGRVQIVSHFPDLKVQVVDAFPEIRVQTVESFTSACGQWRFVDSFPDFKVQFVDHFPDVKIQFVDAFPGIPH